MGAALLRLADFNDLMEQLEYSRGIYQKGRETVFEYLTAHGIYSLDDVTLDDLVSYRNHIAKLRQLTLNQKMKYGSYLEQSVYAYQITKCPTLEIQALLIKERAVRNKVCTVLMTLGISEAENITYEVRNCCEEYFSKYISVSSKPAEYTKAVDLLKLNVIKEDCESNSLKQHKLTYSNEKKFLMYHPDIDIAMSFYYQQEKKELVFDFSLPAPTLMKRQIFKMLVHVLETVKDRHDRRERFLVPLKLFYQYCTEQSICDIEQLTKKQVNMFRNSMDGNVGTLLKSYFQIVDNIRKYLFVSATVTNWNANVWYLERFEFEEGRMNPANLITRMRFDMIEIDRNRELFQLYMKFKIGVSQRSALQTVRQSYYDIKWFLSMLDEKSITLDDVRNEHIEQFIRLMAGKDIQADTFNRRLISVAKFLEYLFISNRIEKTDFPFGYYLKNTLPYHCDRCVSTEDQMMILKNLKYFPHYLRLMYLNLWCVGLRINEVCTIRGDAYSWDGKDGWIRIYQNKMRKEKQVPIPAMLYELMSKYIQENHIKPDEYVFKSKKGGAFLVGTFSKQFKKYLKIAGIKGYSFRSHDFRHTVGTYLDDGNVPIEIIRDYLGHKDSEMTRQYLDHVPEMLAKANDNYFSKKENRLTDSILRKGEMNGR